MPAKEGEDTDVTEDETDMKQITETAGDPETVNYKGKSR